SGRAVRVQFHGARKFRFRTSPVPVVNCEYATQRHVRLGRRIIELQRSGGGSPSLGHQLARRLGSTTRYLKAGDGMSGPGRGHVLVQLDGGLEEVNALAKPRLAPLIQIETALEIGVVCVQ